jgi:glycosyltransferase involved in cell wall biosynthesis
MSAAALALRRGCRVVVQTHGMVMPDPRLKSRVLDAVATGSVLRTAHTVFALTEAERAGLMVLSGRPGASVQLIPNGVPRQRIATDSPQEHPVVMFLARLHPRKQVMAFAEAARLMIGRGTAARFEIIGPDEGDLPRLLDFVAQHDLGDRVVYRGPIAQGKAPAELRRAAVYVLPAVREVFPMTVLEALSVGTPVVLGQDCGIAAELQSRGAVTISDTSPADLAACIERLLADGDYRAAQLAAASDCLDTWCSVEAIGDQLEQSYAGRG